MGLRKTNYGIWSSEPKITGCINGEQKINCSPFLFLSYKGLSYIMVLSKIKKIIYNDVLKHMQEPICVNRQIQTIVYTRHMVLSSMVVINKIYAKNQLLENLEDLDDR